VWGPGAIELINALSGRLQEASRDQRSQFFLRQRIDIAVKRGNALSVQGNFPAADAGGVFFEMSVDDVVERPEDHSSTAILMKVGSTFDATD